VVSWASQCQRVNYLDQRGDLTYGTVRSIGDDRGNFLSLGTDIRDSHVRITTAMGFEWFPTMADITSRIAAGTMAADR
jgi:hypothetical protein